MFPRVDAFAVCLCVRISFYIYFFVYKKTMKLQSETRSCVGRETQGESGKRKSARSSLLRERRVTRCVSKAGPFVHTKPSWEMEVNQIRQRLLYLHRNITSTTCRIIAYAKCPKIFSYYTHIYAYVYIHVYKYVYRLICLLLFEKIQCLLAWA